MRPVVSGHLVSTSVLLLALAAPSLAAEGDAARGARLAERWCAACHLVAGGQKQAASDAPSFAALARPPRTPEALADYLAMPGTTHARMPDLALSRVDIADIVAYVGTLKTP